MTEYLDRNIAIKRIRAALRARTGKFWSVHGGKGTSWGYITVEAPKSRRISYRENPDCADLFNAPWAERVIEYRSDGANYNTSLADRTELAAVFGLRRPVHHQGLTISPDNWERYVALAEEQVQ